MKNKIVIMAGDPNSINSEIISKVWKKINPSVKKKLDKILGSDFLFKKIDAAASLKIGKHVLLSLLIYLV